MGYRFRASTILLSSLVLGALWTPLPAAASGVPGEHVAEFQEHIDDYEADVARLSRELDTLVADYAKGKADEDDVNAFVESWEEVKYHGAVEEVATPLYPGIWQGISGLRQAVKTGEDTEVVRQRANALITALHQGLGGLKLKAAQGFGDETDEAEHTAEGGPAAAFARIREHLDHALAEYAEGEAGKAKELIHDAYMNQFEGLEGGLIEQDAELVARLEEAFNAGLPGLIDRGASVDRVRAKIEEMKRALAESEGLLEQAEGGSSEVF